MAALVRSPRRWTASLLVLLAVLGAMLPVQPVDAARDSQGVEFWLMFNRNAFGGERRQLFITGPTATSGTVEVPGTGFSFPFTVTPGEIRTVDIPAEAEVRSSDTVENLGVHVVAQDEVTVYGLNQLTASTDAFLGLPTDVLGTEYVVLSHQNVGVLDGVLFGVVGIADDTVVTIIPSASTGGRVAGVPYEVTLDEGQTYQLMNTTTGADLSGSIITSTQPVAAFGGHQCANIPNGNTFACDHIVEQLFPVDTWGQNFVTLPLATRQGGDTFRIVASEDDTDVVVNGTTVATLDAGDTHSQLINEPAEITASRPIMVAQFSNGTTFDGVTSDPFMMLIPPAEQFVDQYTVSTPGTRFNINYVNVVAPSDDVGAVFLDGVAIPPTAFTPIGTSGYSGAQREVSVGTHNLDGPSAFGVFVYGFAAADSYGYPGGLSVGAVSNDGRPPVSLSVTAPSVIGPGETFDVVARLRNIGTGPATNVSLDLGLGAGLTLLNPPGALDFTTIPAGGLQVHNFEVRAADSCAPLSTSFDVRSDYAERPPDEAARHVQRELLINGSCGGFSGQASEFGAGLLPGTVVQACEPGSTDPADCRVDITGADGSYEIDGLPAGSYDLRAIAPADKPDLIPIALTALTLGSGQRRVLNFSFGGPVPPPDGTEIEDRGAMEDGIPVVYWGDPLDLRTTGCEGGTARYEIRQGADLNADQLPDRLISGGGMTTNDDFDGPDAQYTAVIPPLSPNHDWATVFIFVDCPGGVDPVISFDIYIDPSGNVYDIQTGTPVPLVGATMTLYHSDTPGGPFAIAPDGSTIMSPANRKNPDLTDGAGHFGWDVRPGYYKVRAEKAGCTDPANGAIAFVETRVYEIPPPVFDIVMNLNCGTPVLPPPPPPPPVLTPFEPPAGGPVGKPGTVVDPVLELAGPDRIDTAIDLSQDEFRTAPGAGVQAQSHGVTGTTAAKAVVLASSTSFPDGLVASPLAALRTAPLLLNPGGSLDSRVVAEIRRVLGLNGSVVVVGGTGAISQDVARRLEAFGFTVTRIAGTDRYRTSVAVAQALGARDNVLLATGRDFPDALAAGAAAAGAVGAVLLTDGASLPAVVRDHLAANPTADRYAVGGAAVAAAPDAVPLAGADRYATAVAVARRFFASPRVAAVATGEAFPDALAGGAHVGRRGGPLLLTASSGAPDVVLTYLRERAASIGTLYVYGGPSAVPPAVRALLQSAIS